MVDSAWKGITYEVNDLIESVNIRHNGGIYTNCKILNDSNCHNVYSIIPLNTIHFGRCYTIELSRKSKFYAFDNVVLVFKRDVNVLIHGLGQEIGIIGNFFPVDPSIYHLTKNTHNKVNFHVIHDITDSNLGCDDKIDEDDYYKCTKDTIEKNITTWTHPRFRSISGNSGIPCMVPMYSYILRNR